MMQGQDLSYDRAMFLSVNSVTLTGFQQVVGPNEFNPESSLGPMIVLALTIAGSLLTMIAGGWAAVRTLRLPYSDSQVVVAALTVEVLAILAGSAFMLGDGRRLADAMQLAASAFGNSGAVQVRPGNAASIPALGNWRVHCILLPLSVLGGLGLPVLMELYDAMFRVRRLSNHSKTVLSLTGIIYLGSVLLLTYCAIQQLQQPNVSDQREGIANDSVASAPKVEKHLTAADVRGAIVKSSAASLDARTAGLPLDFLKDMPVGQWFVLLLMIVGASPAGTGGGAKTTTFYAIFAGARNALARRATPRTFGIALAWLGIYGAIVFVGFLLLTASEPQVPGDRLFFLTVSAVSNVGLSHDPISIVSGGSYLLSWLMLIGRIAPLGVLWWTALGTQDADLLIG
jgi:trk system potassium uptake protein TrkH